MSQLTIELLLLALISISGGILLFWGYLKYERVKQINYIKDIISKDEKEIELLKIKKSTRSISLIEKIEKMMLQTGINVSIYIFMILFLLFVFMTGSLFSLFLKHWLGYLIGIPFGAVIFYMIIQVFIRNRKKEFNRAFAISISVLVKMMKTGVGFEQAMFKSIEVSNSKVLKKIFDNFFKEKNTIGEEEAFANITKYVDSKELRIFALAVKIGRSSGGRFSNTIEKVEQTLVYRKNMQERVDVVTREGSFGSYIVSGIAVFLYFALNANFDGKLHHYFMESEYGRFQLLAIFLWVFAGLMVNKMITRIKQ